ncbi:MAG: hypothetical protein MUQ10_09670 [Anaerolineae bacterium]|nr:hypothetical protein [Anaerolineae bacterium]
MIHTTIDMFPPLIPLVDGEVSVRSQQQFYRFMQSVYQTIFEAPELLFTTLREDDAYPHRYNRAPYGKPRLIDHMKSDLKRIDGLLALLFSLGRNGAVDDGKLVLSDAAEVKKNDRAVLPHLGLGLDGRVLSCDGYEGLFDAWRWMATRENATVTAFSRCMFDPSHSYVEDVYRALFGSETAFDQLARYLREGGYTRYDLARGPYTLDYAKRDVEKRFRWATRNTATRITMACPPTISSMSHCHRVSCCGSSTSRVSC